MSDRPRLLFLCQTLPYPPDGGVNIRTFNVLRLAARSFDVTALCFYRRATARSVSGSVEALGRFARIEAFPIPQEHGRVRLLLDHARSVVRRRAYTVYAYESADFRRRLASLLATERFDLVHVDSLDLAGYLPMLGDLPVVCVHHNVESMLLRRRAEVERSRPKRAYMRLQARLLEREERRWAPRVALNATVSEEDRRLLQALAPGARTTVVPNGVDVDAFRPAPGRDRGIVFVGGTTWFPNKDALAWFAEAILPILRRRGVTAPVTWVGRATEAERAHYREAHGIELTGYVDDIRPYVHDAACFVVPLRVGGGTRLKILDAWAMGKAVVSTAVGCEGLEARDGENILVRDEPEAFAAAVEQVLADATLRRRLADGARCTAERIYSWEVIGERMAREYLGVVEARG
jgi:glycosyltransferase involved in cell wall biosynthesis